MSETKLTERQQKILNLIKESPTITGKQMSETLSVSQRTSECGLIVNSSRAIIYADSTEDFARVAGQKAAEVAAEMDACLKSKGL